MTNDVPGCPTDGVRFVIDNRLKDETEGYPVAIPEAEGPIVMPSGGNAPKCISKHVEQFSLDGQDQLQSTGGRRGARPGLVKKPLGNNM